MGFVRKFKTPYVCWRDYAIAYDEAVQCLSVNYKDKMGVITNFKIENILYNGESIGGMESFAQCEYYEQGWTKREPYTDFFVRYSQGSTEVKWVMLKCRLSNEGIKLFVKADKPCIFEFSGDMNWGNNSSEDVYPMSTSKQADIIRSAMGPASTYKDDLLFDRLSDRAVVLKGAEGIRFKYNYEKKHYVLQARTGESAHERTIRIAVMNDIIADQYHIHYSPLNKNTVFSKPPVGWMSWYAVQFDASEETILKNARWMSENLKKYGAECVWVDWEWCHKGLVPVQYDDGTNVFHPDKESYPNGLGYVADRIKDMGLVPALWIGFTGEVAEDEFMKAYPDMVLCENNGWFCRYTFDYTHPKYLNEFLPKALTTVKEWGFEAIKYDSLDNGLMIQQQYHDKVYDPSISSNDAHRRMLEKTREVLGEDYFMLQCCCYNQYSLMIGIDLFDAARIGADVFSWDEFLKSAIGGVMMFYPLHNNVVYPDSDCVILREEYSDLVQAASRIYFVSMLGIPMTFGDAFEVLDKPRIELIKKCLPVLPTHPMDISRKKKPEDILKMDLAVNQEWEEYHVVNVFNMHSGQRTTQVQLFEDLGLEKKEYLVYDYTKDQFVGIVEKAFDVALESFESRIFSIRERLNRPQVISTSRHISQGAAEIKDMQWKDTGELVICAELIEKVPYTVTLYVPDGFKPVDAEQVEGTIYKKTILPDMDGTVEIKIAFMRVSGVSQTPNSKII